MQEVLFFTLPLVPPKLLGAQLNRAPLLFEYITLSFPVERTDTPALSDS